MHQYDCLLFPFLVPSSMDGHLIVGKTLALVIMIDRVENRRKEFEETLMTN